MYLVANLPIRPKSIIEYAKKYLDRDEQYKIIARTFELFEIVIQIEEKPGFSHFT